MASSRGGVASETALSGQQRSAAKLRKTVYSRDGCGVISEAPYASLIRRRACCLSIRKNGEQPFVSCRLVLSAMHTDQTWSSQASWWVPTMVDNMLRRVRLNRLTSASLCE